MRGKTVRTRQAFLFDKDGRPPTTPGSLFEQTSVGSSTFKDNLSLPVHRWFRYSAGFSATWVRNSIASARSEWGGEVRVLDPFAGSGTVLVEAEEEGVPSFGVESHPFVARVARAKLRSDVEAEEFRRYASDLLRRAEKAHHDISGYPELIRKCYPDEVLTELDQLRRSWLSSQDPLSELGWLALAAILRGCSPVGTANWQYVLPNKTKARVTTPFSAFKAKADQMTVDLSGRSRAAAANLIQGDARVMPGVPRGWANLVITSPPYPNNFDYADATRLEMSFFGDVTGWGDLQEVVRKHLVRACTQHVSPISSSTYESLESEELRPIRAEIGSVVERLDEERKTHAGNKCYHAMVVAYFVDMARMWKRLRDVTSDGVRVCFVVGDSAPYGVHVPVDKWLGELAVASGFKGFHFQKTRDRNVKWKNRKHTFPLHEGHLLAEG
ncbi:MAG TPA: hypothetical protein VF590_17620 [Isosphaeraceae bacterium]|jgi:hypothetical protein